MSVETGIAPSELVELDGAMFAAIVEANHRRWTPELELAAELVELSSAMFVAFAQVHSPKHARIPERIQVPRPAWVDDEAARPRPQGSTATELVAAFGLPLVPPAQEEAS